MVAWYLKRFYYWFGEDRTGFVSNGVSCYQSKDLYNWKRLGLSLKTKGEPKEDMNDISHGRLFERPKVIYNPQTKSGLCGLIGKVVMDMELQESVWQQVTG